ncbi:MAG: hypothetical protein IZT58_05165 [Actinobacteria bacterium]|nr:hypothetical protein [Actinomycetota bacterium]
MSDSLVGTSPTVVVVGLGPGGLDHTTAETLKALERIPHRYLRTDIHPSASLVENATSFDDIYEAADTFEDVYAEIAPSRLASGWSTDTISRSQLLANVGLFLLPTLTPTGCSQTSSSLSREPVATSP